jgi:MoaD family protein
LIRVLVSGQLKDLTAGAREVDLEGARDLDEAVRELENAYPGIGRKIVDDQGRIRKYVNVFVNAENSRALNDERTKLKDGDVVHILPSVAGG